MIIVVAFVLVLLSVPLFGGSLQRLGTLRARHSWAVAGAMGLQIGIINIFPADLPESIAAGLHLVSYALAVVFLYANRRMAGMWLIVVGGVMNLAAIAANDGIMPARAGALEAAGRSHSDTEFQNSTTVEDANLAILGDIFAWPAPLPLANVFSIGDILLIAGVGVTLHTTAQSRLSRAGRAKDSELISGTSTPSTLESETRRPVPAERK